MPYQSTWNNPYIPQQTFQPYQQQVNIPTQTLPTSYQPTNGIVKVNGRDSALQYQLPPNSMSPALFDNNGQMFYIVSTDGTGTKSVEAFDFSPHVEESVRVDSTKFVSREEFDEFVSKVSAAIGARNGIHEPVPATGNPAEPANVGAQGDAQGELFGNGFELGAK